MNDWKLFTCYLFIYYFFTVITKIIILCIIVRKATANGDQHVGEEVADPKKTIASLQTESNHATSITSNTARTRRMEEESS
jgi:hypothetical protein